MIKINKDLSAIPESLKPPTSDFFAPTASIPKKSRTTHSRRMEVIQFGSYIKENKYDDRYKLDDIKDALSSIYHNKCAYCEQRVELIHVEHYRPKYVYYWLAYSWDNLLIACPHCNANKSVHFDIQGTTRAVFVNSPDSIRSINSGSANIDAFERPLMVNPEIANPLGKILFAQDGSVYSHDASFKYTIEKCKLSRTYLRDARRRLLEKFTREARSILVEPDIDKQKILLDYLIKQFITTLLDLEEEFLAFRKFAIDKGWLNQIIKSIN